LQSRISAIQAQKNELTFHQIRLKSLLSPIRKLPREILIEIFSHCNLKISLGRPDFQTKPLGRVCSSWHPAIISTPRIWSNIEYFISDRSSNEESRMQNQLSHILELSGSCPLSVMMYCYYSDYWNTDSFGSLSSVLKCLMETSSRWVSLRLDAELSTPVINFWGLELDLPNLERLDLSFGMERDYESGTNLVAFRKTPKLRCFRIRTLSSIPWCNISLPWGQICYIDYHHSDPSTLLQLISLCPNLDILKQSYAGRDYKGPKIDDDVRCSILRELTIRIEFDSDFAVIPALFPSLKIPSLTSLHLISTHRSTISPTIDTALRNFQGLPHLRHLNIGGLWIKKQTLLHLLRRFPSIEMLSIADGWSQNKPPPNEEYNLDDIFVSKLPGRHMIDGLDAFDPILPHLQYLTLDVSGVDLSELTVVDIIASRWKSSRADGRLLAGFDDGDEAVAALRSIRLTIKGRPLNLEDLSTLRHLVSEGQSITLKDKSGYLRL
jgi:hypothetical protein